MNLRANVENGEAIRVSSRLSHLYSFARAVKNSANVQYSAKLMKYWLRNFCPYIIENNSVPSLQIIT